MGKFVLANAFVSLEGNASTTQNYLYTYLKSLTLNYSRAEVDSTCMGDKGIARCIGLRDWSLDLEFAQDHADNVLDELMYNAMTTTKASLTVIVRPTTAVVGINNMNYVGEGLVFEYTPASGGVGDLATASVSIRCAGATSSGATSWLRHTTKAL